MDGGDIVDLADGDRFKATVSSDQTTVWGSRYDAATRSWGEPSVVFKKENVFCRDVDARTAGAAVALIARCTKRDSSEARRPLHSQALYSSDTVTWSSFTLPREVFAAPGISPSGTNAIWPLHQHGWVTRTAAGFVTVQRDVSDRGKGREFTGTISDTGDVSVLYVADSLRPRDCVLNVLSVAATGSETRQELGFRYYGYCDRVELTNVDATTVLIGRIDLVSRIQTLTRLDPASPWALTGVAPADAPGLIRYGGRGTATTRIAYSPGLPMLAVGSPDQKSFTAQTFDPVAQTWSVPAEIKRTVDGCHWRRRELAVLAVFVLRLTCSGNKERILVSTDAQVWHDIHRSPLGVSPDGRFVATSNQKRTLIFSRERGVVRLRLPTRARCDVVQPVSPDSAIRLTTTAKRGWPGRLDVSTAKGWKPTTTPIPRLGFGTNRCGGVDIEEYDHDFGLLGREWRPVSYNFVTYQSGDLGETLTISPRGDGWKVRRTTIVYR